MNTDPETDSEYVRHRIAGEISIDRHGAITIDGVLFPHYVTEDIHVKTLAGGIYLLTLKVYADKVTMAERTWAKVDD